MTSQIGLLLFEIDKESAQVHQGFKADGRHRNLGDFSRAILSQQTLDGILKPDWELSDIEAKVLGTFYAALGFRLVDASTEFDEEKFRRAEEILKRAEDVTMDTESTVLKAKYHRSDKMSKLAPRKADRIFEHVGRYLYRFRWVLANEYLNLFVDANAMWKINYFIDNFKKYSRDGLLKGAKRGVEVFACAFYELSRMSAFLYSSVAGISDMANGNYDKGALEIGIAAAIPLSRHIYRRRKMEDMLGPNYHLPKLESASPNNR